MKKTFRQEVEELILNVESERQFISSLAKIMIDHESLDEPTSATLQCGSSYKNTFQGKVLYKTRDQKDWSTINVDLTFKEKNKK